MIWSVTLPGQPPTLNKLYQPVYRKSRDGRTYQGIGKNPDARTYHAEMAMLIRNAKPSQWKPAAFVRLTFRLFLSHDIDADNVLKVLSDAFQTGTGINDSWFLPTIECKQLVDLAHARVEVDVTEELGHDH